MRDNSNIDFSNCDKEPVAFIGEVQSFGALIATDKMSEHITHVSSNIEEFIGLPSKGCIGKSISNILPAIDNSKIYLRRFETELGIVYELEKRTHSLNSLRDLLNHMEDLRSSPDLQGLLSKAANIISKLTGLDRVMIYKFHEDLHGEVVAERVKPGVESFFGLHYPASDIPAPARELFRVNWLRMIADVSAKTYPIISQNQTPLNLSCSLVRAVSPIHLEYLKNMKVSSSLTISLRIGEELWGLIACQDGSPRYFSSEEREAFELIGRTTSLLIQEFSRRETEKHTKRLSVIHQKLVSNIHNVETMGKELTTHTPNLLDLINAEGAAAALSIDGQWVTIGSVPNESQLDSLLNWLNENHSDSPLFHTHHLPLVFPPALKYSKIASGLLAVSIPKTAKNYILWFKPEYIETVTWAGNPNDKIMNEGRLSPRKSFSEWSETVNNKSRPWMPWECEAALELRNAVNALDLRHQFKKEQAARAEAEKAVSAREELISIVSHDLKNPLSSILISSQLLDRQLKGWGDKVRPLAERIQRSASVMNNLIEDILNITKLEAGGLVLDLSKHNITNVILETVEILAPIAREKSISLKTQLEPNLELYLDHWRILQVVSNILGNAIKFSPEGGTIIIRTQNHEEGILVSVEDSGPGIPAENVTRVFDRFWQARQTNRFGTGLGLAIAKEIVSAHKGKIWAESEYGKGCTFCFILPNRT